MTDHFVRHRWVGMGHPAPPYNVQRRREHTRIALLVIGVLFIVGCGLAGLSDWQPQL